jgi:hypothetical protein
LPVTPLILPFAISSVKTPTFPCLCNDLPSPRSNWADHHTPWWKVDRRRSSPSSLFSQYLLSSSSPSGYTRATSDATSDGMTISSSLRWCSSSSKLSLSGNVSICTQFDIALASQAAYHSLVILLNGTGYHTWDLPKKTINEQVLALKWSMGVQMMYHPLMFSIRASIIMFLFRMKDNRRRIRYSLHAVCQYSPYHILTLQSCVNNSSYGQPIDERTKTLH